MENIKKGSKGNSIKGKVLVKDTQNSLIRSEEKLVVSIGLDNIIIIETKDAVLVANKNNSQKIKEIVNLLNEKGFTEGRQHKKFLDRGDIIYLWKTIAIGKLKKLKLTLELPYPCRCINIDLSTGSW